MREAIKKNYHHIVEEIREPHPGDDEAEVQAFLKKFEVAPLIEKQAMMKDLKENKKNTSITKQERKGLNKQVHHALVQRSMAFKIASA